MPDTCHMPRLGFVTFATTGRCLPLFTTHALRVEGVEHPDPEGPRTVRIGTHL